MTNCALSRHAALRANQRGVTHAMIDALLTHADIEASVGDGCTVVRFSRARLADRGLRQTLGGTIDRMKSVVLVLGGGGEVVTVLHDHGGLQGRRYRRQH